VAVVVEVCDDTPVPDRVEDRVVPGVLEPLVEPVDVLETLAEPDTVAVRYIVRVPLGLLVRDERDVDVRLGSGERD